MTTDAIAMKPYCISYGRSHTIIRPLQYYNGTITGTIFDGKKLKNGTER